MQLAQSYGKVADTTSEDCCGTKILCSSFIWHTYESSSVNRSHLHIRTEVADIQGHNVRFKPPADWTWSLWLSISVIRPLQLCGEVLWNGHLPTSIHGFCITALPLSATNTVKYTMSQKYFLALPDCFPTRNETHWKPLLLTQLCVLPWSMEVPWSLEGGLDGGFICLCERFWLPSCLMVRYGSQTEPADQRQIPT